MTDQREAYSGVRTGPLREGERVCLTDAKGRRHSIILQAGKAFHTTKGAVYHDDIIGRADGITVTTVKALEFLVTRNLLNEYMVAMHREAAIVYPKDAAQIIMSADVFPGARVLEAGAGSGALSLALLRAVGPEGHLTSYERRPAFAARALNNVTEFFGEKPANWDLVEQDLAEADDDGLVDRVVLDMLAPWEVLDVIAPRLEPGGMLCCYATTIPQVGRIVETLRAMGGFTDPGVTETMVRTWHVEGLSIRPDHGLGAHTGFLIVARRLAEGVSEPRKRRRPSVGAYGPDYQGPRPPWAMTPDDPEFQR